MLVVEGAGTAEVVGPAVGVGVAVSVGLPVLGAPPHATTTAEETAPTPSSRARRRLIRTADLPTDDECFR